MFDISNVVLFFFKICFVIDVMIIEKIYLKILKIKFNLMLFVGIVIYLV